MVSGWSYIIPMWPLETVPNVNTLNWTSHSQGLSTTGNMPNMPFIPDARLAASNCFPHCRRTILVLSYSLSFKPTLFTLSLVTLGLGLCKPHFCPARWIPARLRQWGHEKQPARLEVGEGTCSFLAASCFCWCDSPILLLHPAVPVRSSSSI